jgi:hypothetical protein
MMDEVLITVEVSQPRRWFGLLCLWGLALMVAMLAFSGLQTPAGAVFLIALACALAYGAVRLQKATAHGLELTREALRDTSGDVLARVDQIDRVDRSMFAFKPSNGFLVVLNRRGANAWRPGLWWRVGRRVGVGGMANAPQTKAMAEVISAMLLERSGKAP